MAHRTLIAHPFFRRYLTLGSVLNICAVLLAAAGFYFNTNSALESHTRDITANREAISEIKKDMRLIDRRSSDMQTNLAVANQKLDDLKEQIATLGNLVKPVKRASR